MQAALAASDKLLGKAHPTTLTARLNLARTLAFAGDLPAALDHAREVSLIARTELGPLHPLVAFAEYSRGVSLTDLGHPDAAESAFRQALDIADDREVATELRVRARHQLGRIVLARGASEEARRLLQEALDLAQSVALPPDQMKELRDAIDSAR